MLIKNRNVENEYDFRYEFEAGLVLTGLEVKRIRIHSVSINEAYCFIISGRSCFIFPAGRKQKQGCEYYHSAGHSDSSLKNMISL